MTHDEKIRSTLKGRGKKYITETHEKIRKGYKPKTEAQLRRMQEEMEYLPAMADAAAIFDGADAEDVAKLPHVVAAWTPDEVAMFLRCIGFEKYSNRFQQANINGLQFLIMEQNDYRNLGAANDEIAINNKLKVFFASKNKSWQERFQLSLGRLHGRVGIAVAKYPCWSIILSLIAVIALTAGISQLEGAHKVAGIPVDHSFLYNFSPKTHIAWKSFDIDTTHFSVPRDSSIIFQRRAGAGGIEGILDKDAVLELLDMHESVVRMEIEFESEVFSFKDLCFKPSNTSVACGKNSYSSVLAVWNYNRTKVQQSKDIVADVNNWHAKWKQGGYDFLGHHLFGSSSKNQTNVLGQWLGQQKTEGTTIIGAGSAFLNYQIQDAAEDKHKYWKRSASTEWEGAFLELVHQSGGATTTVPYATTRRSFGDGINHLLARELPKIFGVVIFMMIYCMLAAGKNARQKADCSNQSQFIVCAASSIGPILASFGTTCFLCSVLFFGSYRIDVVCSCGRIHGLPWIVSQLLVHLYPFFDPWNRVGRRVCHSGVF